MSPRLGLLIVRIIACTGLVFAVIGLLFPIYMYLTYGFSDGPLYNADNLKIGTINYFWVSVAMGLWSVFMGSILFIAGMRILRAHKKSL